LLGEVGRREDYRRPYCRPPGRRRERGFFNAGVKATFDRRLRCAYTVVGGEANRRGVIRELAFGVGAGNVAAAYQFTEGEGGAVEGIVAGSLGRRGQFFQVAEDGRKG